MTRQEMDLVDYVNELTQSHMHQEHYEIEHRNRDGSKTVYGRNHPTKVPSLLAQLVHATPSSAVDEHPDHGLDSRPAARLDALDTLTRIDTEAARWVRWLGHDDPGDKLDPHTGQTVPGSGTLRCIRLLGALAPHQTRAVRAELTCDMSRWRTWARIVSGWDSPAWRPDNTCPMCGERRTLRVNLAAEVAFCVHDPCRTTWDSSSIGLLADHIRAESETERVPPPAPVSCHCRWPAGLREQGRWGMCPVCGSHCCVNAEAVAEREQVRRERAREEQRLERMERIARQYGARVRGKVS